MIALYLAASALAAGGTHGAQAGDAAHDAHGIPWDTIALQSINVVIFLGILIWLARKPIGDALKNRALAVSKQLDEADRLKAEAAARAADIDAKLVSLGRRVEEMKAEAAIEADKEAARLEERAQADAARIRDTAERTIREETNRARNELRGEAARLAVQLARETLKRSVTPDDQERLAREFLSAVAKETPNG
jgi:F-type H+-transporting ATPase subunit b